MTLSELLWVLWHILIWASVKPIQTHEWYTHRHKSLLVLAQGKVYRVPATGLDAKTKGLALAEPPAIFRTQRAAFAHQGNKTYSCSCWREGFWKPQSRWHNGLQHTEGDVAPGCPTLSTGSSCPLAPQQPGAGRSPWDERDGGLQQSPHSAKVQPCWCKCMTICGVTAMV